MTCLDARNFSPIDHFVFTSSDPLKALLDLYLLEHGTSYKSLETSPEGFVEAVYGLRLHVHTLDKLFENLSFCRLYEAVFVSKLGKTQTVNIFRQKVQDSQITS